MKFKDKPTNVSLQMIGILISALILVFGLIQCSTLPTEPQESNNEPEIITSDENAILKFNVSETVAINGCVEGWQRCGARYKICMPPAPIPWNGLLVVYAHGYVNPFPKRKPEIKDDEIEGVPISQIVTGMGFAFATTSYYTNGLVNPTLGIANLVDLVKIFKNKIQTPLAVFLVGASEGGLITTRAVEKRPDVFNGGLATCGPIGNFRKQINYFGDFRVVFDYFFPGVIPGSPVSIPRKVMKKWDTVYVPRIIAAISSNTHATEQLLRVTRAAIDPADLNTVGNTVIGILWYNVFGTNDAVKKLRGQPFDNSCRIYIGSDNDIRLNLLVKRFKANRRAIKIMNRHFQTSGHLVAPLVTMHTTLDEIVPVWHEQLYLNKTGGSPLHTYIPIARYGHCNFTKAEVLAAFGALVQQVTNQPLMAVASN